MLQNILLLIARIRVHQNKASSSRNKIDRIEKIIRANNTRRAYKGINSIREEYQARSYLIRDEEGNLVADVSRALDRWADYFHTLLRKLRSYMKMQKIRQEEEIQIV